MRVKLMAFMKARQGLTRAKFVEHYEGVHVPLIWAGMPHILDYRRSFLPEDFGDFDVVTEIWFPDRSTFDEAVAIVKSPAASAAIAADEEFLFDRARHRIVVVDERGGPAHI